VVAGMVSRGFWRRSFLGMMNAGLLDGNGKGLLRIGFRGTGLLGLEGWRAGEGYDGKWS
jgi:hypothetical protein